MSIRTKQIDVNKIKPNPWNPNAMSDHAFAELKAEVEHLGRVPKPVVLRQNCDGFEIVDGEHGWQAAKELGHDEVTCEVIEADDFEAMRQTFKRNQHGSHNKVLEGRMFRQMMTDRGLSRRQLAKEIELSEGKIRTALLWAEAADLRIRYAPGDMLDSMTDRQLRYVMSIGLPARFWPTWYASGAKPLKLPEDDDDPRQLFKWLAENELLDYLELYGLRAETIKSAFSVQRIAIYALGHGIDYLAYVKPIIAMGFEDDPVPLIAETVIFYSEEEDGETLKACPPADEFLRMAQDLSALGKDAKSTFKGIALAMEERKNREGGVTYFEQHPLVVEMRKTIEAAPAFVGESHLDLTDQHTIVCIRRKMIADGCPVDKADEVMKRVISVHDARSALLLGSEFIRRESEGRDDPTETDQDRELAFNVSNRIRETCDGLADCIDLNVRDIFCDVLTHFGRDEMGEERDKLFADREKLTESAVEKFRESPSLRAVSYGGKLGIDHMREWLHSLPWPAVVLIAGLALDDMNTSPWIASMGLTADEEGK